MIINKRTKLLLVTIILLSCVQIVSAGIDEDVIHAIKNDYYDVYGSADLKANIACDNVFNRGEDAVLNINIMNDGQITGFEANTKQIDDDIAQYGETLTRTFVANELLSDRTITKADSMTATLSVADPNTPVDIKLDTLLLGSLSAGKSLGMPAGFPIKVQDNAKAGTYPLMLHISYRYQKDSAVTPPYGDTYYWYEEMNQTMFLNIVVKEEPYFKVTDVVSELNAGNKDIIKVTYTNSGEQVARECVARISAVDPFSTTDDQAYLGDIYPGESRTALFTVKVADDATVKEYSVNSEVKYKDIQDSTRYSKGMKVPIDVEPAVSMSEKVKDNASLMVGLLFMVGIIGTPAYMIRKKKRNH
ncbi:MAG: hypothetical protein QCH31_03015 [Methanolobus sp.]|nr:hypothetical protein [Methanolobus sp.]